MNPHHHHLEVNLMIPGLHWSELVGFGHLGAASATGALGINPLHGAPWLVSSLKIGGEYIYRGVIS